MSSVTRKRKWWLTLQFFSPFFSGLIFLLCMHINIYINNFFLGCCGLDYYHLQMATKVGPDGRTHYVYTISGVRVEFPAKAYPTQIAMMDKVSSNEWLQSARFSRKTSLHFFWNFLSHFLFGLLLLKRGRKRGVWFHYYRPDVGGWSD